MGIKVAANTAEKVKSIIAPIIQELEIDLWDVRFVKEGASWYLRIYIDKDEGISLDDCTNVSRAVDPVLDETDPIEVSYYLEVCSPGLCRELTRPEHFAKMVGRDITVSLFSAIDGKKNINGSLLEYQDGNLILLSEGEQVTLQKAQISKACLNDSI